VKRGVDCSHKGGDELNRKLLDRLNDSGKLHLTHTTLAGRYTPRFCVGKTQTEGHHVRQAWEQIQRTAKELE